MTNMKKSKTGSYRNILLLVAIMSAVALISFLEAANPDHVAYFGMAPSVANIKPDQLDVAWTVFPDFNERTHYQVQLNHSLYGSSQKTTGTTVRRLEPGGTYDVAIVTYHDGKVAGVSSATTVLMGPPAPVDVYIYDVASAGFKVIWQRMKTAEKYRVYRFPDILLAQVDDPANKATVNGLNPGEKFSIFVTSVNSSGESYKSESKTVQLLPPPPALTIVENEIGPTWFSMKWNAVENATGYSIYINEAEVAQVGSGTLSYRAENLPVGTAVSVKMKAENSAGASEVSEAIIVQLLPATPILAVSDVSSFSCTLQWSVANGATYYKVFENDEWCIFNVPASINQVVVSQHVTAGMIATYTVKAGNGTGESEPSLPVMVTFTSSPSQPLEPLAENLLPNLLQQSNERLSTNLRGKPLVSVYFPAELDGPELALEATWLDRLASEERLRRVKFFGVFTHDRPRIKTARRENINWKIARSDSSRWFLPGNLPLVRFYDSDGWLRKVARVSMLILTPEDVFKELPEAFEQDAELIELYREEKENFETLHHDTSP
jgi:hypothetical protein